MTLKIATWNVNSIAVRLPQLLDWLRSSRPDIVCLQEIKCTDDRFPAAEIEELGYQSAVFGQPTYNGVAILSLGPIENVHRAYPDDDPGGQRRLIDATIGPVRVIDVYIPNGFQVGSDKFAYKLQWLARLRRYLEESCDRSENLILCGDFNIAPEPRDVHDPAAWEGRVLFTKEERDALQVIADWGLIDLFRQHHSETGLYSWWDYRAGALRRNLGLRIDHLWATESLAAKCTGAEIARSVRQLDRPSDHAPVIAEFDLA
ncbi:MAG: exodeoxyribonuclease III [Acidobacteriota bacterium]